VSCIQTHSNPKQRRVLSKLCGTVCVVVFYTNKNLWKEFKRGRQTEKLIWSDRRTYRTPDRM